MKYYAMGNQEEALKALQQVTEAVDEMEAEIVQQAKEIEQLRNERDEARRIACGALATGGWDFLNDLSLAKDDERISMARDVASERIWDCFEEKEETQ